MQTNLPLRISANEFIALQQVAAARPVSEVVSRKLEEFIERGSVPIEKRDELKNTKMSIDVQLAVKLKGLSETLNIPVARIIDAAVKEIIRSHATSGQP